MKKLLIVIAVIAVIALVPSCAVVRQHLTLTETTTNGVVTVRESRATAYSLFDGRAAIQGLKTSNATRTQSIGLAAADTESSTTNAAATIDALARLLGALPK